MVVKGVLLCSLLLLVVSVLGLLAQAPGDADGACLVGGNTKSYPAGWRVLMDSRNYVDLLGGSQPAWRSRDLDGQGQGWNHGGSGGACQREVRTCDISFGDQQNWLFTQFVEYRTGRNLQMNMVYDLRQCPDAAVCGTSSLTAFRYETNENDSEKAQITENYSRLFLLSHPASVDEVNVTFGIARSQDFYKGFHIGISDGIGICGSIRRIIIYHIYDDSEPIVPAPPQQMLLSPPIESNETTVTIHWRPSTDSFQNIRYHIYISTLCTASNSQPCDSTGNFTRENLEPLRDLDLFDYTVANLETGTAYAVMVVAFFASQTVPSNLTATQAEGLLAQSLLLHATTATVPAMSTASPSVNPTDSSSQNATTMGLSTAGDCTTGTVLAAVLGFALLCALVPLCILCFLVLYARCHTSYAKVKPDLSENLADGGSPPTSSLTAGLTNTTTTTTTTTAAPATTKTTKTGVHAKPTPVKLQSKRGDKNNAETQAQKQRSSKEPSPQPSDHKLPSLATGKQHGSTETPPPSRSTKEQTPQNGMSSKGTGAQKVKPLLPPKLSSPSKIARPKEISKETREQKESSPNPTKEDSSISQTGATVSALTTESKPKAKQSKTRKTAGKFQDCSEDKSVSSGVSVARPPVAPPKTGRHQSKLDQQDENSNPGSELPPTQSKDTVTEAHATKIQSKPKRNKHQKEASPNPSTDTNEPSNKKSDTSAVNVKPAIPPKSPLVNKKTALRQTKQAAPSSLNGDSKASINTPGGAATKSVDHKAANLITSESPTSRATQRKAARQGGMDGFSSLRKKPMIPPAVKMTDSRSDPNLIEAKQPQISGSIHLL